MTKPETFKRVHPVIDYSVRSLCIHVYPNHPHGCPNYGKKTGCPPHSPKIDQLIDLSRPVWAIWNIFDFAAHCKRMLKLHPEWKKYPKKVACCLYWQPKARKQLMSNVAAFLNKHRDMVIVLNPEGAGVNVTATMASIGHHLQWPPTTRTYQVALAGYRK